jgi:hypothetical protein
MKMALTDNLKGRGITVAMLNRAIDNTEKVLAIVISNSAKNVTNAQAMKGNISTIANDLETLYKSREELKAIEDEASNAAKIKEDRKVAMEVALKKDQETKARKAEVSKETPPASDEV